MMMMMMMMKTGHPLHTCHYPAPLQMEPTDLKKFPLKQIQPKNIINMHPAICHMPRTDMEKS